VSEKEPEMKARNRVQEVVGIAAAAAGGIAEFTADPRMRAGASVAKSILGLLAQLLERRSPEEVVESLRRLVTEGAKPITDDDLREQEDDVVARFTGGDFPES